MNNQSRDLNVAKKFMVFISSLPQVQIRQPAG